MAETKKKGKIQGAGEREKEDSVKLNRANYYARRVSRAADRIELDGIVLEQTANGTRT